VSGADARARASAGGTQREIEDALRVAEAHPGELLAVVGPTASGKTALAVALAERLGGEIVSADSVQVYREFDIGSGKPSAEELARAPHHLVGALDPWDPIDASAWAARATRAVEEVRARGRVPVVCGGTFLWVKALLYGLAEAPAGSPEVRERLRRVAEEEGRPALHARLRAVDPALAERLHPNDVVRVSRGLEVWEATGRPLSAWQADHGFARARHAARLVAPRRDPGALTDAIRARARAWLAGGWIEEVEALLARGYAGTRAMGSVGYSQVRAMLAGELAREELETAVVRATRVFARRQRTWLHHADVTYVGEVGGAGDLGDAGDGGDAA
jgi:tRNA dimethylallyltransferase